jgi:DNA repair exonuclease SbcCD ATPase subunit
MEIQNLQRLMGISSAENRMNQNKAMDLEEAILQKDREIAVLQNSIQELQAQIELLQIEYSTFKNLVRFKQSEFDETFAQQAAERDYLLNQKLELEKGVAYFEILQRQIDELNSLILKLKKESKI